ncbi:hypothetical protein KAU45_07165 [bacterium]|nr:hypothetical protein [bacterium]
MKRLAFAVLILSVAVVVAVEIPQGFAGGAAGPITLPEKEGGGGGTTTVAGSVSLTRYHGDGFSILYPRGWETYEDEESLIFDSNSDDLTAPYVEMYFFEIDPMHVQDFTDEVLYYYDMWFKYVWVTEREVVSEIAEMFMVYYIISNGIPLAKFSVTMTDEDYGMIASYVCGEDRWDEIDGVTLLADMLASIE